MHYFLNSYLKALDQVIWN